MVQNTIKIATTIIVALCVKMGKAQLANEVIASITDVPNRLPEAGTQFLGTLGNAAATAAAEAVPNTFNWQQYLVDSGINIDTPEFDSILNIYQNLPGPLNGEADFAELMQNIADQGIVMPDQLLENVTSITTPEGTDIMESATEPLRSVTNSIKDNLGVETVEEIAGPLLKPLEVVQNVASAPAQSLEAIQGIAPKIVPADVADNLINLENFDLPKTANILQMKPEGLGAGFPDLHLLLAGGLGNGPFGNGGGLGAGGLGNGPLGTAGGLGAGPLGNSQLSTLVQQFLEKFKNSGNVENIKANLLPQLLGRQVQSYLETMGPELGLLELPSP